MTTSNLPDNTGLDPSARQALDYEETAKIAGAIGIATLALGIFLFIPFVISLISGVVGLHFAYRARSLGEKAKSGVIMGWFNIVGTLLGAVFFLMVLLPAAFNSLI